MLLVEVVVVWKGVKVLWLLLWLELGQLEWGSVLVLVMLVVQVLVMMMLV